MHALTGCDSVSAFSGKGKGKVFKLMMKKERYVKALVDLGSSWELSDETAKNIEEFVCELYGKKCNDSDLLRYDLYCAKGDKVEPEALPPCRSSLKLHIFRANYQSAIWRRAVFPVPEVPPPHGYGWKVCGNSSSVQWLGNNPTPEEILELLCFTGKRSSMPDSCCCLKAGLKCTDPCASEYSDDTSVDNSNDYSEEDYELNTEKLF